MDLQVLVFFHLFLLKIVFSVTLNGGPNCSSNGNPIEYAVPGDTINLTCAVDSPDGGQNTLTWMISSFGVLITNNFGLDSSDNDQPEFQSIVNDFNNTVATTNATLSFPAVKDLDELLVSCGDNNNPVQSSICTLFILTTPSAPTSFNCTNVTPTSLTLQWSEPADNGGEQQLQYNITGIPGNTNENVVNLIYLPVENLTSNTTYNFTIRAGNSVGFGPGTSVVCTTEREKPLPKFPNITVCLDLNVTEEDDPSTSLHVEGSPCPLSTIAEEFTPEIASLNLFLNGDLVATEMSPEICDFTITIDPGVYTVDLHANNSAGITISSYNSGSVFNARLLSDVQVNVSIDNTTYSAEVHYTTADCVERDEFLEVKLISSSGSFTKPYNSSNSSFLLTNLAENATFTFTLNVVVSSIGLTLFSTNSSFTVPSTPPETLPTNSTMPTTNTTTDANSTSGPTDSTDTTTSEVRSDNLPPIIGGVVGGIVVIAAIIVAIIVIGCIYYKKRSNKTSVDLLGIKGGSGEPIPLRETKEPIPETGQALYQEPDTIQRMQAPSGDLYTQPDKPRRQPPPPGGSQQMTEMATYQDPSTIERQQAPTGDMYAMPQKKPVYSQVNKENKVSQQQQDAAQ